MDVAAALDRSEVTDLTSRATDSSHCSGSWHNVRDTTRIRSSMQRALKLLWRWSHISRVDLFPTTPHGTLELWDGKLLLDITSIEKVDRRLPVLVSGAGVEQLPGVPRIAVGTGETQKTAVWPCLNDWNLRSKTKCLCFDITSTNTGHLKVVYPMLYIACRHHVMEIVAEKVITVLKNLCFVGTGYSNLQAFPR